MQLTLTILLILTFGVIIYQDFKSRTILWVLFPVGLALCLVKGLLQMDAGEYLYSTAINLVFIFLMLFTSLGYFAIKSDSILHIFKQCISLGDVFMFILLSFCFSTINLILFLVSSLLLILLAFGVLSFVNVKLKTIPLAGILSGMAVCLLAIELGGYTNNLLIDTLSLQIIDPLIRMPW
jgi:hypothetical protein